jgi:hypothetical protein
MLDIHQEISSDDSSANGVYTNGIIQSLDIKRKPASRNILVTGTYLNQSEKLCKFKLMVQGFYHWKHKNEYTPVFFWNGGEKHKWIKDPDAYKNLVEDLESEDMDKLKETLGALVVIYSPEYRS